MIKKFTLFNESIRDKMTPKSDEDIKKALNKIKDSEEWLHRIYTNKFNKLYTIEEIKDRVKDIKTDNMINILSEYNLIDKYSDKELTDMLSKLKWDLLETIYRNNLEKLLNKTMKDKIKSLGGFTVLTSVLLYDLENRYTTEELKDLITDLKEPREQLDKISKFNIFKEYSKEELRDMISDILPQSRHYFVKKYNLQYLFDEKELDKLRRMSDKDYDTAMKIYNES